VTERLSDAEARIASVQQISSVIGAMRGIAAVRAREAREHLAGIRAYAQTLAGAIGQALALAPPPPSAGPEDHTGHAVIALCAEQGFAGAFSAHVLDEAEKAITAAGSADNALLLVGARGLAAAVERGLAVSWSTPMVAHANLATVLANRIADALYARLDAGRTGRVTVVHALPGTTVALRIVTRRLVPFDYGRFPARAGATTPLLTLPPPVLLARIAEEYVFAELCEAVTLSFAAENEARMRAMLVARTNVGKTLENLQARARQLRQEEITSEIVELAGGAAASLSAR